MEIYLESENAPIWEFCANTNTLSKSLANSNTFMCQGNKKFSMKATELNVNDIQPHSHKPPGELSLVF